MAFANKNLDRYYRLIHADSAMGLQHRVNELIEEGFVPLGRAFLLSSADGLHADYYQTLVHKEVNHLIPEGTKH